MHQQLAAKAPPAASDSILIFILSLNVHAAQQRFLSQTDDPHCLDWPTMMAVLMMAVCRCASLCKRCCIFPRVSDRHPVAAGDQEATFCGRAQSIKVLSPPRTVVVYGICPADAPEPALGPDPVPQHKAPRADMNAAKDTNAGM